MTAEPQAAGIPERVADDVGYLLYRLGGEARRRYTDAAAALGMRPAHHPVLAYLDLNGARAQSEIADALGVDRAALVGVLDELEAAGWAERRRDPADRRRHAVEITAAGRAASQQACAAAEATAEALLGPLEGPEREQLRGLLRRLAAYHDPHCPLPAALDEGAQEPAAYTANACSPSRATSSRSTT